MKKTKNKGAVNMDFIEEFGDELIVDNDADLPPGIRGFYAEISNKKIVLLNKKINTQAEKRCVLLEEIGHYKTSAGNITDQSKVENRKQEKEARAWAYRQAVGLSDLVQAYKSGVRNRYELSEFLNVTEDFLQDALDYYKGKYGVYIEIDNYIIYFAPFGVLEKNF